MHKLDEVWWVPAYKHAFGKTLAPFSIRTRMCRSLISGLGNSFRVSDMERKISSDGRMLLTLRAFRRRYPSRRFKLIVGSDTLVDRKRWYRFGDIEREFGILVVPRDSKPMKKFAVPNVASTFARGARNRKALEEFLTPDVFRRYREPRRSTRPRESLRRD